MTFCIIKSSGMFNTRLINFPRAPENYLHRCSIFFFQSFFILALHDLNAMFYVLWLFTYRVYLLSKNVGKDCRVFPS